MLGVLSACGADAASGSDRDASADENDPEAPVPKRDELACEPLGDGKAFELETDFVEPCGSTEHAADRAFVWTAPATGWYRARVKESETLDILHGGKRAALFPGSCVADTTTGGVCLSSEQDPENGDSSLVHVARYEKGQTVTLVVDGARYGQLESGSTIERLSWNASFEPLVCPRPGSSVDGVWQDLESVEVPFNGETTAGAYDLAFRTITCGVGGSRQPSVDFTARQAGTYRISALDTDNPEDPIALAVLEEQCTGDELACEKVEQGQVSLEVALTEGQRASVLVELDGFSDDDARLTLSIEKLE